MEQWLVTVITVIGSVVASGGFWSLIQKKADRKDTKTKLLIGMCHDRILYLGMLYIERGSITRDEFINIHDCLYIPYAELGGNGAAKRIMAEVEKLPIQRNMPKKEEKKHGDG